MTEITLTLTNAAGLHARPGALFVQKAATFKSKVTISGKGKSGDGKSIMQIMKLGLGQGTEITISADGPDEAECIAALKALLESNFGEG